MTKRFGFLQALGAAATLAIAVSPASAQVWDNGGPNGDNGHEMTASKVANDFSLAAATILTSIRFWGFEVTASPDFTGGIFWEFYNNSNGPCFQSPCDLLFSGFASAPTVTTSNTPDYGAGTTTAYQIDIDLTGSGVSLTAGVYWLSLHNGDLSTTSGTGSGFYWATADIGGANLGTNRADYDDAPFGDGWTTIVECESNDCPPYDTFEHAFQLSGVAADVVAPEPASLVLLGSGLVGLAGAGTLRRKRKVS